MQRRRIHSHCPTAIIEWIGKYSQSRDRPRAYLGTQALFCYFPSFNFANNWCSVDELLSGPDYRIPGNRSKFKIDAYVPLTYVRWMDKMSGNAIDYIDDFSPDNLSRIEGKYGSRLKMVRDRSMHLKRAMIIYYKICHLNPAILEMDLDLIRPQGFEDKFHNFQNTEYTIAYSNKLAKILEIDFSRPPTLQLTDY